MRLRVAIVGAGIGAAHLDGYLASPDLFEVAVISDLDSGRAAPLVERSGAAYVSSLAATIAASHAENAGGAGLRDDQERSGVR